LFIIWCALSGTSIDTRVFIIRHLAEVAKTSNKNVIRAGGTVTSITNALGYSLRLSTLKHHFLGGHLDLSTLHHMYIIDTRGDTVRYPHHKTIFFTLPNVECTMVANKRNWNCDQRIVRITVLPRKEQSTADEDIEFDEEGDEVCDEKGKEDIDTGRGNHELEAAHAVEVVGGGGRPTTSTIHT